MYLSRSLIIGCGMFVCLAGVVHGDVRTSWIKTFDGAAHGEDGYWDLAFDSQDNVIVGGWSVTDATLDDLLIAKYDPSGRLLWTRTWDGPQHDEDWWAEIVVDGQDNVYVHGTFHNPGADWDMVLLKFDAGGQLQWERVYDGPAGGEDASFGADMVGVDAAGNVYLSGYTAVENGGYEMVAIKYDANGNQLWVRTFAGAENCPYAYGYAMAVTPEGNVYLAGDVRADNCYGDIGLVVYDTDGNVLWTASYDGPLGQYDGVYALAVDDAGDAYAAGISDTTGGFEAVLVKFTETGDGDWSQRFGGDQGFHYAFAVAVDADHNAFMTGASMTAGGQYDIFTFKANADGSFGWAQRYWADNWWAEDWGYDVEAGADGSVYVAGLVWDGFTHADDAVTLKYDANGALLFDERYNGEGSGQDGLYVVELAPDGSLYVAGYTLSGSSSLDGLLIKYLEAPCTGGEAIDSANCQDRDGVNRLIVKLSGGLPGDPFTVVLSSGESKTGTIKDTGRGKAKFKGLPSGPGTATATWGCGATQSMDYDCP